MSKKRSAATHYTTIALVIYKADLENLDGMVRALKANGHYKANRSALIRHALETVDLEKIQRGV